MNNGLTEVYQGDGYRILGIKVQQKTGEEYIRLYIELEGVLKGSIEFELSKLSARGFGIKNFGKSIKNVDLMKIFRCVEDGYGRWNTVPYLYGIGWQKNRNDKLVAYDGQGVISSKRYLDAKGNFDTYKDKIMEYLSTPLRQAVYVAGIAAVIAGLLEKNILLSLSGKSSTGKTTLAELALSAFSRMEDEVLCKNFNGTDNGILNSMVGINGACVLIDDTSLRAENAIDMSKFIYSLESGMEKRRLGKDTSTKQGWYTTTILTSEESILFNCDREKEGVIGRLIEIDIAKDEAFDSAEQANEIQELYRENHGLLVPKFVEYLIKNIGLEQVRSEYGKEVKRLRQGINDQQLHRIVEKVAIITLTARLLNQVFVLGIDVDGVSQFLMERSQGNLEEFRSEQVGTTILDEIYPKLVEFGQQESNGYQREEGIFIEGKAFKKFIKEQMGYKPLEVKRALRDVDLLVVNNSSTGFNVTHGGKTISGICIKIA